MDFWDRVIEFPDHDVELRDLVEILKFCLDGHEIEILCEELLGWPSKGYEILDEFELEG